MGKTIENYYQLLHSFQLKYLTFQSNVIVKWVEINLEKARRNQSQGNSRTELEASIKHQWSCSEVEVEMNPQLKYLTVQNNVIVKWEEINLENTQCDQSQLRVGINANIKHRWSCREMEVEMNPLEKDNKLFSMLKISKTRYNWETRTKT